MNRIIPLSLVSTLLWPAAMPCQAGRPLATEDADILDKGACEWEGFFARETASGSPALRTWATQIGCGIGFTSQVALAYSRAKIPRVSTQGLTLLGKTSLIERKDDGLGLTLAWTVGGEKLAGGSLKHELTQLNLVATQEFVKRLKGHANLGWLRSENARSNSTTWNLATEYAPGGGIDLMGEIYGDDHGKPWYGTGVRWNLSDSVSLNVSYSVQAERPRLELWTAGFKLGF